MCIWRSGDPKSIGKHIVPESAGQYFLGKMSVWRSGDPKSIGKHIAPASPPPLFPRKYCYFGHFRLPTAAGPPGLSESTKYTPDGLFDITKYIQNQCKINISMV